MVLFHGRYTDLATQSSLIYSSKRFDPGAPMPTYLPDRRPEKPAKPGLASILFNTVLVVSALALTYLVLVKEEDYATASSAHAAPHATAAAPFGFTN